MTVKYTKSDYDWKVSQYAAVLHYCQRPRHRNRNHLLADGISSSSSLSSQIETISRKKIYLDLRLKCDRSSTSTCNPIQRFKDVKLVFLKIARLVCKQTNIICLNILHITAGVKTRRNV